MKLKAILHKNRGFIAFMLLLGVFRTAIADWNPIPSGSMRPNLLEGDVVFVNRIAYDLKLPLTNVILMRTGDPQRGEVVTFYSPKDGTRLIKRLAAVPGDLVEMRDKHLIINGQEDSYVLNERTIEHMDGGQNLEAVRLTESDGKQSHIVQWLPEVVARDNFGPMRIPDGQFLMLGDNRDDSADSRYIGLVERKLLIGHAVRVLVSADIKGNWAPRTDRFGKKL